MTNRERFLSALNFEMPSDRLPVTEWAMWWDQTLARWHDEGLDPALQGEALQRYLGLDALRQYWFACLSPDCPKPAYPGGPIVRDEADYERLKPFLYPQRAIDPLIKDMRRIKARHAAGEVVVWFTMDGAFWFPRTLLGIENHLLSFYDQPELYQRIVSDLADFEIGQMEKIYEILTPDFMTIAEDMSYNHGPMISKNCFEEFLAPYYRRVVPRIRARGTKVFIDTDGDIAQLIPWFLGVGAQGFLPLERMAGVDIVELRARYPRLLMIGGFDKTVMKHGEAAMRREFERILPVMRSGGYIPGVDHQTPPDVPLDTYRAYVALLGQYARKALAQEA